MRNQLRRQKHVLAPALLLAIGLSIAGSALSLQGALTTSSLPYPDADRLVTLIAGSKSWSGPMLDALQERTTVFDALALIQERAAVIDGEAGAEVVRLESVSAEYFGLLGVRAAQGRAFDVEDNRRDVPGAGVVISDALWQRRFNADPQAIGRSIEIDRYRVVVLGVLPRGFHGLIGRTDVWIPLGTARRIDGDTGPERPWSRGFELFGRVRAGLTIDAADARYASDGRAAIESTGAADRILGPTGRLRLVPLATARVSPLVAQTSRVLGWASAAVLLFVFVNVASLALLRGAHRAGEIRVRVALGATRAQVAAMAIREAGLLAVCAAAGALALRPVILTALMSIRPPSTTFGIVTAELFATGVAAPDGLTLMVLAIGAVAGALPHAVATVRRSRTRQPALDLRDGGVDGGLRRWRSPAMALIAVQAATACLVLTGGLLMWRSTTRLFEADRGYDWRGVATARVLLPDATYGAANAGAFYEEVIARLTATPGVTAASVSSCAPGAGRCRQSNIMRADGRDLAHDAQAPIGITFVTASHFATLGVTLARGRGIAPEDRAGTPRVVVISEPLAARLWPGLDPIGHTLEIFTANGSLAGERLVVGTVKTVRFGADPDDIGDVFLPAAQVAWTSGVIFAKGSMPARALESAIAGAVAGVDRSVPIHDVASLEERLGRTLGAELFLLRTLMAFGLAGLVLAAIGAYATAAHAVARSQRELGVRIALGATPSQIRALVARRGVIVGIVGATVGAAGAWASGRLLVSLLHGLSERDPVALTLAPAVTVCGLLLAVFLPAWRASRVSVVAAMRGE